MVGVAPLRAILLGLAAAGTDVAEIMSRLGIRPEDVADPDGQVPAELTFRALVEAPSITGDPAFALHMAEALPMGSYGLIDYATLSSQTFREALERAVRYFALLDERVDLRVEAEDDVIRVTHRLRAREPPPHYAVELLFGTLAVRARNLSAKPFSPREVRFSHRAPPYRSEYDRVFRTHVSFEARIDELIYERSILDEPMITGSPALAPTVDRYARTLLAKRVGCDPFMADVQRAIEETIRGQTPSLVATAKRLRLGARTLRRRLSEAGTTYRDLLDSSRRDLAIAYIEDGVELAEVAYILGFSDQSSFQRAFKRWTGQTPGDFRQARQGSADGR
jgi:AraC-like DNA-binding protein